MNLIQALFYFEAPQASYYARHPHWPKWMVCVGWWLRNPFPGVTEFVLGIGPTTSKAFTFAPTGGFQFLKVQSISSPVKTRYFASYRGKHIEGYFGWKPSGSFGIALRKTNAKPETGTHLS